ncbi:MAG: dTDP-glucose 4,6-dehydratase [Acidobacteria bacterium]|nr:dTDP-glucose 4,6-dehydratase [Acidobacteriota bacterium]
MRLLVTGGAGFIGSAFVRHVLGAGQADSVLVLDKLTYAGNMDNLAEAAADPRFQFLRGDIAEPADVEAAVNQAQPGAVVHFAAESHVDRSILSPEPVIRTNLNGTFTLLEAAKRHGIARFVHVSTDEVYGSIPEPHDADETYPLIASSPYSASKAGSDLLALSYFRTFGLNVSVTRASNNYGPFQFPEKLIPLMIANALEGKPLPVYGNGMQVRDWLFVEDHCRAILAVLRQGRAGEIYNIGGNRSLPNIEVVRRIIAATGCSPDLIRWVTDRPGHDVRYALTSAKLERETGWQPQVAFEDGLERTVAWYRTHRDWVDRVRSGEYRRFYDQNYGNR